MAEVSNFYILGVVATGNNIPTDAALAAIIALPIALSQGLDTSVAVSIAVPFGILTLIH